MQARNAPYELYCQFFVATSDNEALPRSSLLFSQLLDLCGDIYPAGACGLHRRVQFRWLCVTCVNAWLLDSRTFAPD